MEEILLTMERYVKVGTADLIVTQYIAHVAEGLCGGGGGGGGGGSYSSGAAKKGPRAAQATFRQLKRLIRLVTRCNMTEPLLRRVTRKFFYNDTRSNRKLRCTLSPPHASTLPRFNASLLLGMPYPSGPKVPLYDSSMLAFRLHHPNVTVRAFAEAFLKQWFMDSAIHGKDQLPQVLLLWRTPGYHPAILGNEFRRFGGPMLFRNRHGQ
ncbi:Hypothetical protein, putative [Bodo saltans]|uniref:Uncharacterized protein n=1 Tax=Bodo saltans TaxID=75058 RepID=A0A0S4J1I5_BODSA|nr:Hypothetical protein, putative [Bodo saltans]|eukprot:CUG57128.1 Hypothetical protein, putative [Bodo saltans]